MTTVLPSTQLQPPAAGLFGVGSGADRAARPRPEASPRQRADFSALFRLEGAAPHLA